MQANSATKCLGAVGFNMRPTSTCLHGGPRRRSYLITSSGEKIERAPRHRIMCPSNNAGSLSPNEKEANVAGLTIREFQHTGGK